jgi:hypothetical protein
VDERRPDIGKARILGTPRDQKTFPPPGEEGQVDYGDGPMVRHPATGKYRRTRLFVFTLGYSRKSVPPADLRVEHAGLV